MGRAPCCDKSKVKRGPWSPDEDTTLKNYLHKHGTTGNWIALPTKAGLNRCGKSCRLRWLNYLKPDIKRGSFTEEEDNVISTLYCSIGSRWSVIASQLPGRTDNDVKNYWNTKLKKKLLAAGKYYHVATRNTSDLNMALLSASVPPKIETPDHIPETSSSCFGGSRGTLPHLANVSSGQSFDQLTQKFEPCNHQFSHSKTMEVSDFGTSERNSSLSQEVSSLPNSSSLAQLDQYHCSLWSGYEAGININYSEFLMGFGFETHPPPGDHFLLDGFGY